MCEKVSIQSLVVNGSEADANNQNNTGTANIAENVVGHNENGQKYNKIEKE